MTDSKTATERLRELLDERGVEYRIEEYMGMPVTFFEHGGQRWSITSHPDGYMIVNSVNYLPEQAIAATLGEHRIRKGLGYRDRPEHVKTEASKAFERELDAELDGTRWHELFGTPEKAAETLALCCFGATSDTCEACVFDECDGRLRLSGAYPPVYDTMLKRLRGKAVKR